MKSELSFKWVMPSGSRGHGVRAHHAVEAGHREQVGVVDELLVGVGRCGQTTFLAAALLRQRLLDLDLAGGGGGGRRGVGRRRATGHQRNPDASNRSRKKFCFLFIAQKLSKKFLGFK